jgi:hypothetical protein
LSGCAIAPSSPKAVLRFKERVRELTRRTRGVSMERMVEELTRYLRGWIGYFGKCETPSVSEETGGRKLRDDIPINLTAQYKREALELRNKLLMFRFRNFGKCEADPALVDRSIEPRLAQIFVPLLSVIEDAGAREELRQVAREYHRELVADRGMDMEAQVLEIIQELQSVSDGSGISIKEIASRFIEQHGEDFERKVTPHWIGADRKAKVGLKTEKRHGSYVVAATEGPKLARLYEKYGVCDGQGDLGDSGDFAEGKETPPASRDAPII